MIACCVSTSAPYLSRIRAQGVDVRLGYAILDGGCQHGYMNSRLTLARSHVSDCSTSDNGFGGGLTSESVCSNAVMTLNSPLPVL